MIQRIQSVYLLLAAGAFGGNFGLPYLTTTSDNPATAIPQLSDGVLNIFDNMGLLGLTIMGLSLSFAAIFLYKNRASQGKMTGLGMLCGVLLLALSLVALLGVQKNLPEGGSFSYGAAWAAPVLGLVFLWLAGKAIKKDEKLVRSMDRLR